MHFGPVSLRARGTDRAATIRGPEELWSLRGAPGAPGRSVELQGDLRRSEGSFGGGPMVQQQ
eukprot:15437143-Alexandrium_andersonii.AAC.1